MRRVLVFPGGSEVGLEVCRSLRDSRHFMPVGGSSTDDHCKAAYREVITGIPWIGDSGLANALNDIADQRLIDVIYPAHDEAALQLSAAASRGELWTPVAGSEFQACEVARSKRRTYEVLEGVVAVPNLLEAGRCILPSFAKPDVGQGSVGARRLESLEDLEKAMLDPNLVVTEYLPGDEVTVDCFSSREGVVRYSRARSRVRTVAGIAVRSEWIDVDFSDTAARIGKVLGLRGAWFFQAKERSPGSFVLMEVGARVAGGMGLSRASGVNLPLLTLHDLYGEPVEIASSDLSPILEKSLEPRFIVDRRYESILVDLDDCLIVRDQVNTRVVAFIYQCRNAGVTTKLVTRHPGDLDLILASFRLTGVFDEVHHLTKGQPKSSVHRGESALLLDDSFRERHEFSSNTGQPAFAPQQIDVLLDDRA